jgi:hypothetical protein
MTDGGLTQAAGAVTILPSEIAGLVCPNPVAYREIVSPGAAGKLRPE